MQKSKYVGVLTRQKQNKSTQKTETTFYIQYYDPQKKRHLEKVGSSLKGMTLAKANNIRSRRIEGREVSNTEKRDQLESLAKAQSEKYTIHRLWEEYSEIKKDKLKDFKKARNIYNGYLIKKFGSKTPAELTALEVEKFRCKLEKRLKPATVKSVLELLNRLINFGVKKNLIAPLSFKIEMPTFDNQVTEYLTDEERKALWQACLQSPHVQVANMLRLIILTGIRISSVLKLDWKDIDFTNGFMILQDSKSGKNEKIPLNTQALELLQTHPKPFSQCPSVFPNQYGKQRTKRPVIHARAIYKDAGIIRSDFRIFHGLRHDYGTKLTSSGKVDLYTLQKLMTHKDAKTTQRYAHLHDKTLKQASEVAGVI